MLYAIAMYKQQTLSIYGTLEFNISLHSLPMLSKSWPGTHHNSSYIHIWQTRPTRRRLRARHRPNLQIYLRNRTSSNDRDAWYIFRSTLYNTSSLILCSWRILLKFRNLLRIFGAVFCSQQRDYFWYFNVTNFAWFVFLVVV